MDDKDLVNRFTHHPPFGDQPQRYETIRKRALDLARTINEFTPDSREKSLAITYLEATVMNANAAIARNEQRTTE